MNKNNNKYLLWTADDKEFISYDNNNFIFPSYESVLKVIRGIETSINEDCKYSESRISKYTIYELGNITNIEALQDKPKILIKIVK